MVRRLSRNRLRPQVGIVIPVFWGRQPAAIKRSPISSWTIWRPLEAGRRPLARFFVSPERLPIAALQHADGPKLAFSDGDLTVIFEFLRTVDTLFVSRRRFVEPPQVE